MITSTKVFYEPLVNDYAEVDLARIYHPLINRNVPRLFKC